MTNVEFQKKLEVMYKKFPIIALSNKKTVNELVFMLRHDNDVPDYCVNINSESQGFSFGMLKESFFPTRILALHINAVEYDECEESEYPCLLLYTD